MAHYDIRPEHLLIMYVPAAAPAPTAVVEVPHVRVMLHGARHRVMRCLWFTLMLWPWL